MENDQSQKDYVNKEYDILNIFLSEFLTYINNMNIKITEVSSKYIILNFVKRICEYQLDLYQKDYMNNKTVNNAFNNVSKQDKADELIQDFFNTSCDLMVTVARDKKEGEK